MQDIVIRELSKSFGEKKVLSGLSHTFPAGEVCIVQGPSGSGKTTLLRILAGLEKQDAGSVEGVPERISFVFQEDRLLPDFSAYRNLKVVTGKETEKAVILSHLAELGLQGEEKTAVKNFSGGMKRRLAIARAMLYNSSLVILDEPFKGLDEKLKTEVMDYVKRHREGRTLILVTHDREEAAYMGGNVLELERTQETEENDGR